MKLLTFWIALLLVYFIVTGCSTPPPQRVQLQCGYIKPDGTLVVYYCPTPTRNGNI